MSYKAEMNYKKKWFKFIQFYGIWENKIELGK